MKTSSLIKITIVITAFFVVSYVIYHSNKAAEITELVSKPTDSYDFLLHVDSLTEDLKNASTSDARNKFEALYEEVDVYASIDQTNGEKFIGHAEKVYKQVVDAYWPFFQQKADNMFTSNVWPNRKVLKNEISSLNKLNGLNKSQQDSLSHYLRYINGYNIFSSLLDTLEKCNTAATYKMLVKLSNYTKYPYNNLSQLQQRAFNAEENAKTAWKNYLISTKDEIISKCGDLSNLNDLLFESVQNIGAEITQWKDMVDSYEDATNDDQTFKNVKPFIDDAYRAVTDRYNSIQNNY